MTKHFTYNKKGGLDLMIETKELKTEKIELDRQTAEKVFKVNLKNRTFDITHYLECDRADKKNIIISFSDKGTCFGFMEGLEHKEYIKRVEEYKKQ